VSSQVAEDFFQLQTEAFQEQAKACLCCQKKKHSPCFVTRILPKPTIMWTIIDYMIYIYMRTFNDVMFAFVSNRVNTTYLYLQLLIGGHDDQLQDFEANLETTPHVLGKL
jgi:hypothetical protein